MQEQITNLEDPIKAALRELYKRQTTDSKWNPAVDGNELIRLQDLLKQSQLKPITPAERDALKAQGVLPKLSSDQRTLVVRANEKAAAQRPPRSR